MLLLFLLVMSQGHSRACASPCDMTSRIKSNVSQLSSLGTRVSKLVAPSSRQRTRTQLWWLQQELMLPCKFGRCRIVGAKMNKTVVQSEAVGHNLVQQRPRADERATPPAMYLSIIAELCHLERSNCLPLPLSPSHYRAEYTVCSHAHASWHLLLPLLFLLLLPHPFLYPVLSASVSSVAPPGGMVSLCFGLSQLWSLTSPVHSFRQGSRCLLKSAARLCACVCARACVLM